MPSGGSEASIEWLNKGDDLELDGCLGGAIKFVIGDVLCPPSIQPFIAVSSYVYPSAAI